MFSVKNGLIRMALAIATVAAITGAGMTGLAVAQNKPPQYNVTDAGLLLKGYDPVAYFTAGKPAKGNASFAATHGGATIYFASAENRDAFRQQPEKYLPAYGGFCAYGVASGYKVDVDPTVWKIVEGKLYVNYNASVGRKFNADTAGFIKQADNKWPALKDKPPK